MIKKYKVISKDKYKELNKKHGARAAYVDLKFDKNTYRCLLNLKQTQVFVPDYFAQKILNEDI